MTFWCEWSAVVLMLDKAHRDVATKSWKANIPPVGPGRVSVVAIEVYVGIELGLGGTLGVWHRELLCHVRRYGRKAERREANRGSHEREKLIEHECSVPVTERSKRPRNRKALATRS